MTVVTPHLTNSQAHCDDSFLPDHHSKGDVDRSRVFESKYIFFVLMTSQHVLSVCSTQRFHKWNMGTDGYDHSILRSLLTILPETRSEQDFTKTGELAVRACTGHLWCCGISNYNLSFWPPERKPNTARPFDNAPAAMSENCRSYGASLTGSAVLRIDRDV